MGILSYSLVAIYEYIATYGYKHIAWRLNNSIKQQLNILVSLFIFFTCQQVFACHIG